MNRALHYINSLGVVALAILCIFQWRANRESNLEANRLEKLRIEHSTEIEDLSRKLKGYTDDLENFRGQITRAAAKSSETDKKLATAERELDQARIEIAQLKTSVTNWADAVATRDILIKEANERIQQLSEQLNANVLTYNKLATNYNAVVAQLDALRAAPKAEKPTQ